LIETEPGAGVIFIHGDFEILLSIWTLRDLLQKLNRITSR